MKPIVTIIMATYNRAHFIVETLNSIISQTYSNWECIIVDEGSVDNTEKIVKEICEKDTRFSYYQKDLLKYRKGLSGTRNCGLDIAKNRNAKYIQLFDDDDIMHPKKIELQILPFINDPTLDMTLCCYRKFHTFDTIEFDLNLADDKSCFIEADNLFDDFFYQRINLNSLGPIWKFDTIKNVRFDEKLYWGEEREFYLRIFLIKNIKYQPVNYVLFWYRKHDLSITSNFYKNRHVKENSQMRLNFKIAVLMLFKFKVDFKKMKFIIKVFWKNFIILTKLRCNNGN